MDLNELKNAFKPLVEEAGLTLYSVEFVNEYERDILRVTVDKMGPVDIDEVSKATELINEYLDKADPIKDPYSLEVTSRGIEKEFTLDEIEYYVGEYIFIKTVNQELYGDLMNIGGATILIKDRKNKKIKINMNDVVLLRTAVKF